MAKAQKPTEYFWEVFEEAGLKTVTFQEAWTDWVDHRVEIRKPMTQRAARMSLKICKELGCERAIRAITYSIANGYQGLIEPSGRAAGNGIVAQAPTVQVNAPSRTELEERERERREWTDGTRKPASQETVKKLVDQFLKRQTECNG